jgi:cytochrome c6
LPASLRILALSAAVATLAACGGTTTAATRERSLGKRVFVDAGCSSCHTLRDAGATGTVCPNLDLADPSKRRVVAYVTAGGAGMPSFQKTLTPDEIDAVSTYVDHAAGT